MVTTFALRILGIFKIFIFSLLNNNDLDKLITSLGLAFLTLLIPLAMGALLDVYQKRREKEREKESNFTQLDLQVILNRVFKIKWLVWIVLLVFIPMLFWKSTCNLFYRSFELLASSVGLFFIASTIVDTYNWIKGSIHKYRLEYLKTLSSLEDMTICWKSVWSAKDLTIAEETDLFEVFAMKVGGLIDKRWTEKVLILLNNILLSFQASINSRIHLDSFLPGTKKIFLVLLDLHLKLWKKIQNNKSNKQIGHANMAYANLSQIIINIEKRSLGGSAYFDHFMGYMNDFAREVVTQSPNFEDRYLILLFEKIFNVILEYLYEGCYASRTSKYFPEKYLETKGNLESNDNIISKIFLRFLLNKIYDLIANNKRKDFLLCIIERVFPNVNWKILIEAFNFIFVPSIEGRKRIEVVAACGWQPSITSSTIPQDNAFELIKTIAKIDERFTKLIDKETIKKYLDEVRGEYFLGKMADYKSFLTDMLKYLEKKDKGECNE